MKRDEKNDEAHMRNFFIRIFNKIAYPLLFNIDILEIALDNSDEITEREATIETHYQKVQKGNLLKSLLNGEEDYAPFDINQVTYQVINPYTY